MLACNELKVSSEPEVKKSIEALRIEKWSYKHYTTKGPCKGFPEYGTFEAKHDDDLYYAIRVKGKKQENSKGGECLLWNIKEDWIFVDEKFETTRASIDTLILSENLYNKFDNEYELLEFSSGRISIKMIEPNGFESVLRIVRSETKGKE